MNIYLLNATETAFLPAHLLVQQLPIKGLIGLENNTVNSNLNEYYDYSAFCAENNIDYIPIKTYNFSDPEDKKALLDCDIDILLSISWQRLLPDWLISHCKTGVVGSHGSPLGISQGRGRSPQNWALLLGCPSFSYSIFWIDPGVDSGAIIDTCSFPYTETDDIMTSYIKAGLVMVDMIAKNYHNGNLKSRYGLPQDDSTAYYLPQRMPEDGLIDWNRPSHKIYDFVRALSRPYPGASTLLAGETISIWQGRYIDGIDADVAAAVPGEVLLVYPGGELLVFCGSGFFLATDYDGSTRPILRGDRFTSAHFKTQLQVIVDRHRKKYDLPVSPLITNELLPHSAGDEN